MNIKEENQKNTNLKEHKITMKKLKRQVKGITLIALVVTIIVLLILAGVAINLTIGDNGIFKRAEKARDIWEIAQSDEQSEMDEAADFIENYINSVDGVPIPDGFYYVGGTKNTGIIISDNSEDANKGDNLEASEYVGNQFVWVPVENPENYFIDETATLNTNATGIGVENEVTTNVYSNFTRRSEEPYTEGIPGVEETEGGDPVIREPDVLSSYDTEEQYYKDILGFDSPKAMAESMAAEYKAMSDSIKKYKGFYIGRYELTANGEKTGTSLTNQNWYNLYKACQNVVTGKDNVKSTMIYGVQWDATMDWLKATKFQADTSKVDEDSSSWGNYSNSSGDANIEGAGTKQNTGFSDYWKANNVYDLAGNCVEWTQEANSTGYRTRRGGNYGLSGLGSPASDSYHDNPSTSSFDGHSTRATLYIM